MNPEKLAIAPHSRPFRNAFNSHPSILLVDDCSDFLAVQKEILEMDGYRVLTAQRATEALKILMSEVPDLILLDMKMDDMTGSDFLTLLTEKNPVIANTVPIVFQSSLNEVPPSRAVGFIQKTGDIETFLECVRYFIDLPPEGLRPH